MSRDSEPSEDASIAVLTVASVAGAERSRTILEGASLKHAHRVAWTIDRQGGGG